MDYWGLFIFDEYTTIITDLLNKLYELLIFYHVNKNFIDYALSKMDSTFDALQRPQKDKFLKEELQDPESKIFSIYTNGNCFRLLAILNSMTKQLKEIFEKMQFFKSYNKENLPISKIDLYDDDFINNVDEFGDNGPHFDEKELSDYIDNFRSYIQSRIVKSLHLSVN